VRDRAVHKPDENQLFASTACDFRNPLSGRGGGV